MIEELNKFINEAEKYTAWSGKTCYRQFGGLDYYFTLCKQFEVIPKCLTSVNYIAQNEFIELEYIEHDIILVVKSIKAVDEWGNENIYFIVDKIPQNYEIWNIGKRAPENILPLVKCDKNYSVTGTKLAIITKDAQTILSAVGIVGSSQKKMKNYIENHNDIFSERMKKAIECLKPIDSRV